MLSSGEAITESSSRSQVRQVSFQSVITSVPVSMTNCPPAAWTDAYPVLTPNATAMPQAWKDALKAAEDAGKIPRIPQSKSDGDDPVYPKGVDPESPEVCSTTPKCRQPDDIWDAPAGYFGQ